MLFSQRRFFYSLGSLFSFGVVLLSLLIQIKYELDPCPLCIVQRMIFLLLMALYIVLIFFHQKIYRFIFTALITVVSFIGMGVSGRHVWLQLHKGDLILDCGVGLDYLFANFPLQNFLRLLFRGTGDCSQIDWHFWGLSLPQYSFLGFLSLGVYALFLYKKLD